VTSNRKITADEAESMAMSTFSVLAADDERLSRFLDVTGLRPETIRKAAAAPGFLGAVLDYVASDERLLLAIAGALSVKPERIMEARQTLSPAEFE
jgi:Protein of unknown function (DUF3572)